MIQFRKPNSETSKLVLRPTPYFDSACYSKHPQTEGPQPLYYHRTTQNKEESVAYSAYRTCLTHR